MGCVIIICGGIAISILKLVETLNEKTKENFKQFVNIELIEKVQKVSAVKLYDGISIILSFSGNISGQIIVNMLEDFTKIVYSKYTGNIPVVEIDSSIKYKIFELIKIIIGNYGTSFYENGVFMTVSSFYIDESKSSTLIFPEGDADVIEYSSIEGKMKIIIMLKYDENYQIK